LKLDSGNATSPHPKISSIEIRLGEWECISDQFNAWFRIARNDYLDDIESEKNIGVIEHPQPGQRAARDSFLFLPIYCCERSTEVFACARLHLHKYQRVIVTTDNVYFTAAAAAKIAQ
jgi:hypothetical protein